MKSEAMIPAQDIVFAIRGAFRTAGACHCHTVAKLGCDELLEHLIGQRVIPDTAVYSPNSIHVDNIPDQELVGIHAWDLKHIGINYLIEATEYTRQELMRNPNWGPGKVGALEKIMARRGLTLRGGNPAIIERIKQEDEQDRRLAETEDKAGPETFEQSLEELIKIGRSLLDDGQLLMNAVARIGIRAADGRKGRRYYITILRKYANNLSRGRAHEVERLIPALAEEIEPRPEKNVKKARKRLERQADERPSNVVRLVAAE